MAFVEWLIKFAVISAISFGVVITTSVSINSMDK